MTLFLFSLAFIQITKMQIYLKSFGLGFYIRKFISYDILYFKKYLRKIYL